MEFDEIPQDLHTSTVDPDIAHIRAPTITADCGTPTGVYGHQVRRERRCIECREFASQQRAIWQDRKDELSERLAQERAALRPALFAILEPYLEPAAARAVIEEMGKHGYGCHGDALTDAAAECPVSMTNTTDGGSIRAWLRGRAGLIQKKL